MQHGGRAGYTSDQVAGQERRPEFLPHFRTVAGVLQRMGAMFSVCLMSRISSPAARFNSHPPPRNSCEFRYGLWIIQASSFHVKD